MLVVVAAAVLLLVLCLVVGLAWPRRRPVCGLLRQPRCGMDPRSPAYLAALSARFDAVGPALWGRAKAAVASLGTFEPGPPKTAERVRDKAVRKYGGDFSRLKDLRRAKLVCATAQDAVAALAALRRARVDVVRVKNRLGASHRYRDLQLIVRHPGTGLLWELQVHVATIVNPPHAHMYVK